MWRQEAKTKITMKTRTAWWRLHLCTTYDIGGSHRSSHEFSQGILSADSIYGWTWQHPRGDCNSKCKYVHTIITLYIVLLHITVFIEPAASTSSQPSIKKLWHTQILLKITWKATQLNCFALCQDHRYKNDAIETFKELALAGLGVVEKQRGKTGVVSKCMYKFDCYPLF